MSELVSYGTDCVKIFLCIFRQNTEKVCKVDS
jgi:hypothetical protein